MHTTDHPTGVLLLNVEPLHVTLQTTTTLTTILYTLQTTTTLTY